VPVQGVGTTGDDIKLAPAKVIWSIHWNAKWTTMSKYQSQVNQTNYLEHMTV